MTELNRFQHKQCLRISWHVWNVISNFIGQTCTTYIPEEKNWKIPEKLELNFL